MNRFKIALFTLGGMLIAAIPMAVYFLHFSDNLSLPYNLSNNLSMNNNDWGSFGSFLSGTTGAIFSFLGTLAVIWTLIVNHKSNEKQINMIRSEQTFRQFNELLDILTKMLDDKLYPLIFGKEVKFDDFKKYAYARIAIRLNQYNLRNPEFRQPVENYNIATISVFHNEVLSDYQDGLFKKEAAIYTILLDRIMNADSSTKEALRAVLDAKLNEHHYFFFNCLQFHGLKDPRMNRMVASGISLAIPSELSSQFQEFL